MLPALQQQHRHSSSTNTPASRAFSSSSRQLLAVRMRRSTRARNQPGSQQDGVALAEEQQQQQREQPPSTAPPPPPPPTESSRPTDEAETERRKQLNGSSSSRSTGKAAAPASPPPPARWRGALHAVNELTKWAVSLSVLMVVLLHRNEAAAWAVVGAVASSFACKLLKRALNHERPDGAPKSDPGMPSSHANSLNFLSVYAALSLHHHAANQPLTEAAAAATVALGAFLTWLRVELGFHTWPQVLVGAALGASSALAWFAGGVRWALPALEAGPPAGRAALYAWCAAAAAAFAVKNVLQWLKEQQQRQQRRGGGSGKAAVVAA